MQTLLNLLTIAFEALKAFFAYDYGKTKTENKQLKENQGLREEYEDIDDMDIAANDAYAQWLRGDK